MPGRDGCRVPLPWTGDAPAFGFSPTGESWLPQPEVFGELAVDRQTGVEGSTLEMYRRALRLRRELGLGRPDAPVEFLEDLAGGLLGLTRGEVVVLVNTAEQTLPLPAGLEDAELLVASGPVEPGTVPADGALWLRRG